MIKRIIQYISYDIWFKKEYEYKSPKVRWAVRQFKVFLFTAQGIGEHSILVRSAALTFYSLMSVVPVMALVFAIAKGFDLESRLSDYLLGEYPQYQVMVEQVIAFANNLLERTRGGLLASAGLVVLFWSIIKVFSNVENSFNNIWEVRKSRTLARKFSDYISVVVVAPVLWILSVSTRLTLQDELLHITSTPYVHFLFSLLSLLGLWAMFTFLYRVMPNTRVKWRYALIAGVLAGTVFLLFQWIYFSTQSGLSNYNAIYGSFAALPLFLIWMQVSWQIVLFGAELSFAYQNINNFEYEKSAAGMSYSYRRKVLVVVMQQIVGHFVERDGAVSSDRLASDVNLPVRVVRDVLFDLERAGLIASIQSNDERVSYYVPARDVHGLKISEVLTQVDRAGTDPQEEQVAVFREVEQLLSGMEQSAAMSPSNRPLMRVGRTEDTNCSDRTDCSQGSNTNTNS